MCAVESYNAPVAFLCEARTDRIGDGRKVHGRELGEWVSGGGKGEWFFEGDLFISATLVLNSKNKLGMSSSTSNIGG